MIDHGSKNTWGLGPSGAVVCIFRCKKTAVESHGVVRSKLNCNTHAPIVGHALQLLFNEIFLLSALFGQERLSSIMRPA